MILHSDRYFEHAYEVKWDLLSIKWPSIESLYLPEILNSIGTLVENVINYNIRNLLVDASSAQLHASFEDANEVVFKLLDGLSRSRLEKLARVESQNLQREIMLRQIASETNQRSAFEFRFFRDPETARQWLQAAV